MSFCNLSNCFSSIPILLLLFIVLLVVLGGFFFVYSFFNKKIEDQNHKLNSMVGLVSTMAHEIQKVRVGGAADTAYADVPYCLRGQNCDDLLMCQKRIEVSDDEDEDGEDEDEDSDEDDDDDSDDDDSDEEDEEDDDDEDHEDKDEDDSDDAEEEVNVDGELIISESSEPGLASEDKNIKRIHMIEPMIEPFLDINETTSLPVLETIKINIHDNIHDNIDILEHGIDINSPEYLKKLSTQKLKQLVLEKGLSKDPSKLNKAKLLKLFGINE